MKPVSGTPAAVAAAALVVIAVAMVAMAWAHRTEVLCPGVGVPLDGTCVAVDRWTGTVEHVLVSHDRLRDEIEAERGAAVRTGNPELYESQLEFARQLLEYQKAQAEGGR